MLLFAEDVSEYTLEELTFKIEEELSAEDEDGLEVILPEGDYSFNSNLGEYGGYELDVSIEDNI